MKRKFSRILGVGLALAMLTSLMVLAAPASAASSLVIWGESNIPKTDDYMLGPAGMDVIDLAANGDTIYAVGRSHGDNYTITLLTGSTGAATWSDTQVAVGAGSWSAKLHAGFAGGDYAQAAFTPPTGITLDDMATITSGWSWQYFIDSNEFGNRGTQLELRFTGPNQGYAEMTIMDKAYGAFPADPPTLDAWTEQSVVSATTTGLVFGRTEGNIEIPEYPDGHEGTIADLVDHIIAAETVGDAGDWELTGVKAGVGWIGSVQTTAYVDLVTIDGISYDLERDDATTGQAYQLDGVLYKSSDSGATWSSLATSTYYPSSKSVKLVAAATDDENIVTMVTTDNYVYYSSKGGSSWSNLKNPSGGTAVINDVDVSAGTYRYVVAGGTDGTVAELYTMYLSMAQAWAARVGTGFASNQDSILAVKFSPNYATDKIILVVSEEGSVGSKLQVFWYETKEWNASIPGFTTGYPVSLGVPNAIAASIAIPQRYLGNDEAERIVFVGTANTSSGNVMRLIDYSSRSFELWTGADEGQINSIAYNDSSEILLAGSYDDSAVYSCQNTMASYPKFERQNDLKQPGGNSATASMVVVGWSGDNAVAGTSGDESAFAISTDDGYAFNDISLIDTKLSAMDDVAVNADGSKVYLTSSNGTDSSVWLKEGGTWSRVFSRTGISGTFLVRIAPDDDSAVYVAEQGTRNVWVSKNSGTASWKNVPCYKVDATNGIQDFAVESADVVYAIDSAGVSKTVNAGSSWGTKNSHKVTGHMVTLAPNGDVLVGGGDGYMSWSTDGGSTFTKSTSIAAAGVKVQVVADSNYAENGKIYAGAGTSVKRSYVSGDTLKWSGRGPDLTGWEVTGMFQDGNVTYVLTSDGINSRFYRALDLLTADTKDLARWSYLQTESTYPCQAEPQALKMSAGPQLWAIDTGGTPALVSWKDPIANTGPTMTGPAEGATITVNPSTSRAYNVTFTFDRFSSSEITICRLQIATDPGFDGVIFNEEIKGIDTDTIAVVVGPTGGDSPNRVCEYMPGSTYYWRVRVDGLSSGDGSSLISEWSEGRSFTVAGATAFAAESPVMGATDVSITPTLTWSPFEGALSYEVELSDEPTFVVPLISRNTEGTFFHIEEALAYSTTYYWRVRGVTGEWVPKQETAGGPWATGVFTTMGDPAEALPPIIIEKEPAPPAEVKVVEVPVSTPAPIPAVLLWVVVAIGAILVIALIILIVRTRRVA